jgi:hypothetical protein
MEAIQLNLRPASLEFSSPLSKARVVTISTDLLVRQLVGESFHESQ